MKIRRNRWTVTSKLGLVCAVALGLLTPPVHSGPFTDAVYMLYDGVDPEFANVYAIGEPYLPPSVHIQPLKASKDAIVTAVDIVANTGLDDRVGAVAFSSVLEWTEPLTTDFARIRSKLRGSPLGIGGGLAIGIQASVQELNSARARSGAQKVIVLVTDGSSDSTGVIAQAQLAKDAGMTVHVVGVGDGIDAALLDQIAAVGGGVAIHVNTATPPWMYAADLQAALGNVTTRQVGVSLIR